MPPTPIVVLEIDDNTPAELPAFTNDVSMWSFAKDFNLATRTAEETFRKMHQAVDSGRFPGVSSARVGGDADFARGV